MSQGWWGCRYFTLAALGLVMAWFGACSVDERHLEVASGALDPAADARAEPSAASGASNELLPLGAGCTEPDACASRFCTDGVCCDRFCQDVCAACNLPGQAGRCGAASDDPLCQASACLADTECRSYELATGVATCEAVGRCRVVGAADACSPVDAAPGTPCRGGDGLCDGVGACQVAGKKSLGQACAAADECAEGSCAETTAGTRVCCDAACASVCQRCSADGHCSDVPAADARCPAVSCPANSVCREYGAPPAACRDVGSCATAADCRSHDLRPSSECDCSLDGACHLVLGVACAADEECASGACVDGICCDRSCDACERCAPESGRCVDSGECECRSGALSTCGVVHGALGACAARVLMCTSSGRWPARETCAAAGPEVCDAQGIDEDCDGVANERPPCEAYAEVDVGRFHVCAVSTGGNVLCWGFNEDQQVGDGLTAKRLAPFTVPGLSGVQQVSAGESRSCALLRDGSVRCWGNNRNGALGNGTSINSAVPVRVNLTGSAVALDTGSGTTTCAVLSAGGVSCWGALVGSSVPTGVPGLEGVSQLSGGFDHMCGLVAATGTVRCFGGNGVGQLGNGNTTTNLSSAAAVAGLSGVRSLSSGVLHTCALLGTGQVQCWGGNTSGQLGDGTTIDRARPTPVAGISSAIAVGAGDNHTCAVLDGGSIRCWGNDDGGQLGQGMNANRLTPVPVVNLGGAAVAVAGGQTHTCALLGDGSIRCWGQVLGDGTNFSSNVPVRVLAP